MRFELTAAALAPELQIIAPGATTVSATQFPGRAEMIDYCEENKIPVQATAKKPYSMDRNLLHISFEAGILEDPWFDASRAENTGMYQLSVSPGRRAGQAGIRHARFRERQSASARERRRKL